MHDKLFGCYACWLPIKYRIVLNYMHSREIDGPFVDCGSRRQPQPTMHYVLIRSFSMLTPEILVPGGHYPA